MLDSQVEEWIFYQQRTDEASSSSYERLKNYVIMSLRRMSVYFSESMARIVEEEFEREINYSLF